MERRTEENFRFDPQKAELYTGSGALLESSRSLSKVSDRPLGGSLRKGIEIIVRKVRALEERCSNYCVTAHLTDD